MSPPTRRRSPEGTTPPGHATNTSLHHKSYRQGNRLAGATLKYLASREGKAEFAGKLRAEVIELSQRVAQLERLVRDAHSYEWPYTPLGYDDVYPDGDQ